MPLLGYEPDGRLRPFGRRESCGRPSVPRPAAARALLLLLREGPRFEVAYPPVGALELARPARTKALRPIYDIVQAESLLLDSIVVHPVAVLGLRPQPRRELDFQPFVPRSP